MHVRRSEEVRQDRQEEKVELLDVRRKVKGALAELHLALHRVDKLLGK